MTSTSPFLRPSSGIQAGSPKLGAIGSASLSNAKALRAMPALTEPTLKGKVHMQQTAKKPNEKKTGRIGHTEV
jgi:hypothetical protein